MTDKAKFLKKKFWWFGSYVFLEVAYNDALRQCLTSISSIGGPNLGPVGLNQTQVRFFAIFLSLNNKFSLKLNTNEDSLRHVYNLVEVKPTKKNFWVEIWTKRANGQIFSSLIN